MQGKVIGGLLPDPKYIVVVRKWQVPVGEFSINWPVKDLPVKLLPVHLRQYPDAPETRREWQLKNDS